MLDWFRDSFRRVFSSLELLFSSVGIADILDILVVSFLIFEIIVLVRNTRAAQLAKGVVVLLVVYMVALLSNMRVLLFVLQAVVQFGVIVLAVVFQPELRRAIEQVGGVNSALSGFLRRPRMEDELQGRWQRAIVAVCDAAERMAEKKVGALIVLENQTNLIEILRTGTLLHCDANADLLETVFYDGTPLHDGAAVLRDGRIEAAGCFLPLSNNLAVSRDMGTRHRSALGLSENSDAVVVVVSEETGIISVAKSGVLIRRLDRQNLFQLLTGELIPPLPQKEERMPASFFRRKAKESQNEKK